MSTFLLLTVGTGTAGKTSNLAAGLRATIERIAPRRFWLAPSSAPDSTAMAELVREGFASFCPATITDPFFTLSDPDDLEGCRRTLGPPSDRFAPNYAPPSVSYSTPRAAPSR